MNVEDRIHNAERRTDKAESRIDALEIMLESYMKNIDANVFKLVTRHEFDPIKLLVYGLVGCILTGFIGAVLSRILVK